MRALVLVGGQGTRLRPLTYAIPKPMLPIVEKPMIARVIEWLGEFGVEELIFSLGYQPNAFFEAFEHDEHAGVHLRYAVEPEPLDTAGAIRFAAYDQEADKEPLIVVNGDILTDLDLAELISFHVERSALASIALTPVEDPSAFGVVPTDDRGRVTAFIEKPPRASAPTNRINAGTYVLEPEVIAAIPTGRRVSIEREIFPNLVRDAGLYAMSSDAYWLDTGTPESYLRAQFDILEGRRAKSSLPDSEQLFPDVFVERGARVEGTVAAPAFIGSGAIIEAGAHVERSVIGAGCLIRSGATVRDSVLLPSAVAETGAAVSSSLIGPRAVLGAGCLIEQVSIIGADEAVKDHAVLRAARVPE